MSEPLSAGRLDLIQPVLRHLADMTGKNGALSRSALEVLALGIGLDEDWVVIELDRWAKILLTARGTRDPAVLEAAQRALLLRGLAEAPATLAISTVMNVSTSDQYHDPTSLQASVSQLDFGTVPPGQTATLAFEIGGGPGQIEVGSDQLCVDPSRFDADRTQIRVRLRSLSGGLLWCRRPRKMGAIRVNSA